MHRGYVKLYRSLVDWEWYKKPNMVQFLTHCLIRANHKEKNYKGISLKEGQFISGRKVLADETGLSEQQVRTCIKYLKSTNELTTTSTKGIDGKYTVFELINWKTYQIQEEPTKGLTKDTTKSQPKVNQGLTTNKNVKNEKNVKNNIEARELAFYEELKNYLNEYPKEMIRKFYDYWREPNKSMSKMKWESEKTWSLPLRLSRWAGNNFDSKSNNQTFQKTIDNTPEYKPEQSEVNKVILKHSGQSKSAEDLEKEYQNMKRITKQ